MNRLGICQKIISCTIKMIRGTFNSNECANCKARSCRDQLMKLKSFSIKK